MATIATINGIDEDDIATHNGAAASTHASKNGDTWGHYAFGGTAYGYAMGNGNSIEKYSFTSDVNSTDVGNMTTSRNQANGGGKSSTHGYVGCSSASNVIDKFAFASDGDATSVGIATVARDTVGSSSSASYSYIGGGWASPGGYENNIDKYSHASDSDATDVGNLAVAVGTATGQTSSSYGYVSGGDG